jgi:hypothetical protein
MFVLACLPDTQPPASLLVTPTLPPPFSGSSAPQAPELEALGALLAKVAEHTPAAAPRQKTFFSIGDRGHWETPASDVLAFFLNPHGEHGFGPLFLRAFFRCMKDVNADALDLESGIQVWVEEYLLSGERIDLVLRAPGWILAIENKIYHGAVNDFVAYAKHVRDQVGYGRGVYLAVLAPDDKKIQDWTPVTYRDYLKALEIALNEAFPNPPLSKWQFFARDFIDHLQNLLYPIRMKLDPGTAQFTLVEENLARIEELKQMSSDYNEFLVAELSKRLAALKLPDRPPFTFKTGLSWALVCDSTRGEKWQLAFFTPAHAHEGNRQRKFIAGVSLRGASEALHLRAQAFNTIRNCQPDKGWGWKSSHDNRGDAVESLCEMVRLLFGPEQPQVVA